jgi:heavy metal sensor kinase
MNWSAMGWFTRVARSLRFRLTVSYVLLFAVLLTLIGLGFSQNLERLEEDEIRAILEEGWGSAKGYLRIEKGRAVWTADTSDNEEAVIVDRLRYVHLLADANGKVVSVSPTYESIGIDSPAEIRRILQMKEPLVHTRTDANGVPYLIKAGVMPDEHRKPYFFAIGRSLAGSRRTVQEFNRSYFLFLPVLIALTGILGWALAGRAIRPVNSVAQAAQTITGSNLSLKIPLRGAGDELDHLIDNFNRMTGRLQQSFEQVRQFSTDVSHELRTPLTAIRGQLEVALLTANTPEQYRDAILTALEAVEQLSNIVKALLLLSQAESGQLVLQKMPLSLGNLAAEVVDQFQIHAEEKGISLGLVVEETAIVSADRTQIERLLSNLLSNAVKYTPRGSVTVRIGRDPASGGARIIVEDTGVGIPAASLPHIFDRFYRVRTTQTGQVPGLGLGLSFVSWIVSAHGGKIDVSSTENAGTRFTIVLPDTVSPAQPLPPELAVFAEPRA